MHPLTEHALHQRFGHRRRSIPVRHYRRPGGAQEDRPIWFFNMRSTRRAGSSPAYAGMPVPQEGLRMIAWGTSVARNVSK